MRHWLWAGLLFTSSAYALNLGPVNVESRAEQPLSATIPITLTPKTSINDYHFNLEGFSQPVPPISVKVAEDGTLRLTSEEPIHAENFQFVMVVKQGQTELKQTYLMVLEAPEQTAQDQRFVYGPVKAGDNLWFAAKAFAEHYDIAIDKAVSELYKHNKRAFVKGNMDSLMEGSYLSLPEGIAPPKGIAQTPPVQPEPVKVAEVIKREVEEQLPPMVSAEEGTDVALNLNNLTGSLELLVPSNIKSRSFNDTVTSVLGQDDKAFVKILDKMQSDLLMATEAIDTERRAKEALQTQLNEMQIQIKALTELIHLKETELKTMLTSGDYTLMEPRGRASTGLSVWQILPDDLARLLAIAGESQLTLLLMAILVSSLMLYLWDRVTTARDTRPGPGAAAIKQALQSTQIKAQPLTQPPGGKQDVDVYMAYGRYQQAEHTLMRALKNNPNDFDALYKLFQVYVKTDNASAYRDKLSRISDRWKQRNPGEWRRAQDLYERAWPMAFEGHGDDADDETYEGDPPSDPIQTKLDLARAYLDIGDHNSAAEILKEVIQEGTPAQVQTAQLLLNNIKH